MKKDKENYFEKFDLPTRFDIDLGELEKKYFELQQQFHPDKSGTSNLDVSTEINHIYHILHDDFERACYLLLLKGVDIKNDTDLVKSDPKILHETFILQEKIMSNDSRDELKSFRDELRDEEKKVVKMAVDKLNSEEIGDASQLLIKAKYLRKSAKDIKEKIHG